MTLIEELEKEVIKCRSKDIASRGIRVGLLKAIHIVKNHSDWIPTSKRCPNDQELKEDSEFLVCVDGAEVPTALYCYKDNDGTYSWNDYEGNSYDVIAWQNMPEFYKEEAKA